MQAIQVINKNDKNTLKIGSVPDPELSDSDIQVKIVATALNR
ncbi:MAG: NADP-dependent oxidoreductase, partial [Aliifodinibius sp.]|nr:NADP-dependent oxidoreductase [Fodinibius sp.]NIV14198.1 NADP-dependent oxidoreductase [Fodinibius sp.]NIY28022.1 NADP-dependent oxidoreductase [Fodinibius sp.]